MRALSPFLCWKPFFQVGRQKAHYDSHDGRHPLTRKPGLRLASNRRMAKNTIKSNSFKNKEKKPGRSFNLKIGFLNDRRFQLTVGFFLLGLSLFFLVAFISYLFTGKADQSVVESIQEVGLFQSGLEVENWMKLYGALSAHYFIFEWFGVGSFLIPPLLFLYGYKIVFKREILPIKASTIFVIFFLKKPE